MSRGEVYDAYKTLEVLAIPEAWLADEAYRVYYDLSGMFTCTVLC